MMVPEQDGTSPQSVDAPQPAPSIATQQPGSAAASGALLIVQEVINYVAFLFRVPVAICFAGMAVIIFVILQDVYFPAAPPVANPTALTHIHLDGGDFVRLYGGLSIVLYVLSLVGRLVLRDRWPRPSYRAKFLVAAAVATLGWGFALYNVPSLRVASGTSRTSLALLFVVFYVLTLVAFALALALSLFADYISAAGARMLGRASAAR